ncbi:trypsin-like peptidase domain-containing protein [Natrinema sp. 1APR25-10V2]|uniref:trypsin-like peptidase domain-containing protein n=1 Tax=Natrinema sp. 1APR25-10V2 TaxID=2951081 RepID=UPI0028761511|nr:trypsin-like peptidase domain-containing protein [Natrinema sp. 1APR25-10V2]MDS0475032.1 serine protease [Natrinema sp. 1APR25-10V2]
MTGVLAGCTNEGAENESSDEHHHHYHSGESRFTDEERSRALTTGKRLRESVAVLSGQRRGGNGTAGGTAWHIGDGYFVTNGHVVRHLDGIELHTLDDRTVAADVVESAMDPDVAVLETDAPSVPAVTTGDESTLESEQLVLHVGHPSLVGEWVISMGRFVENSPFGVLTDVPSKRGYSGAPLATLEGDVVGLTTGSIPRDRSGSPSDDPEPDGDTVHENLSGHTYAHHVPISTVESRLDEWTR